MGIEPLTSHSLTRVGSNPVSGAQEKNVSFFFPRVKKVVLTRCRCAKTTACRTICVNGVVVAQLIERRTRDSITSVTEVRTPSGAQEKC